MSFERDLIGTVTIFYRAFLLSTLKKEREIQLKRENMRVNKKGFCELFFYVLFICVRDNLLLF